MPDHQQTAVQAELARAKVNLALHITGQRNDGYHLLESLVAFPQIGDRVALEPSEKLELVIDGPFARELGPAGDNNLVLRAVRGFAEKAKTDVPSVKITLTKRLPVASGIGGGSSDAATTLRLLEDVTGVYLSDEDLHELAASLGADVPVCLSPEPQVMRGIGDDLAAAPLLPDCGIVLVNPKASLETPDVFRALDKKNNPQLAKMPDAFDDIAALIAYLTNSRNDLQTPAMSVCGAIGEVLNFLQGDSRILFSRMSGSGATCFGLCAPTEMCAIETDLRTAHPDWWIASGPLS
ncbi:4-(cytidine 5'-diphospho)-2-C-methyl-D-erythritol kinase [Labrenzia sp. R4_1]|uniref:4-(cytidine 5'-diphospho)-2-C-methyl-D-erythritol kinase n=1 Tax=Labrenzia sp. R4_1 TaxID=2821106 RepID=UPI001ADACABD|nr:4-(cytidine 5'-diphospho)-2-C-methyl-D-erythritol kinase [Labrenzia sp. R4_1]MBO9425072.1 4-(cytidine 5'-diphospho)-2-C-methyl-D-erythritol kinase [Labrenzia sp. R4_1]